MNRTGLLFCIATLTLGFACVDLTPPWNRVSHGTAGSTPPTTAGSGGEWGYGGDDSSTAQGVGGVGGGQVSFDAPGLVAGSGGGPGLDVPAAVAGSVETGGTDEPDSSLGADGSIDAYGSIDVGGRADMEGSVETGDSVGTADGAGGSGGADGGVPDVRDAAPDTATVDAPVIQGAPTFHCGNWTDERDNFVNGNLVLSGLSAADDYATVLAKATAILGALKNSVGANSVRIPINEATASGAWWKSYKGAIDASLARGMKVILAYWAWQNGKENNRTAYFAMWKTLVDTYVGNDLVYFEIFNNPYGYTPEDFMTFAALWLSTNPTVPKARVIVPGSKYNEQVTLPGADSRLTGTLLSLQIYPFYKDNFTSNSEWTANLEANIGAYGSRTIVTAWGAPMTTGTDYSSTGEGDNSRSFVSALSTYLRRQNVGSCYWPMLRTADTWSLTTVSGSGTNLSLNITNASGLARIRTAFGL